jgi:hypothetical protein
MYFSIMFGSVLYDVIFFEISNRDLKAPEQILPNDTR